MKEYVLRLLKWTSNNRWFYVVRKGLLQMQGIIILGCISLLFSNVAIPFMESVFNISINEGFKTAWLYVNQGSLAVIALMTVISISYVLVDSNEEEYNFKVNPLIGALIALSSYLILTIDADIIIDIEDLGVSGVFTSIIISLIATEIYLWICKRKNLTLRFVSEDSDLRLEQSMIAIIPTFIVLLFFAMIRWGINSLGFANIQEVLNEFVRWPISDFSSSLISNILYRILLNLLWFLGLHGSNILGIVNSEVQIANLNENIALLEMGREPVNIFTNTFSEVFVHLGGSGATLCLVSAILILRIKGSSGKIGKVGLLTGIFNINEPLIYGLPIMLNPIFLIPFIFVPVILTITTYFAMRVGLVPLPSQSISWTTPVIANAYMATGSISGIILQLFNLAIGTCIYVPFVKASERCKMEEGKEIFEKLKRYVLNQEKSSQKIISRTDEIGGMARAMALDFKEDLKNKNVQLFYQPQVNANNEVVGVEALLRWKHENHGWIAPPIAVELAEEANYMFELNRWIFDEALRQSAIWRDKNIDVIMSINVSPLQFTDKRFASMIEDKINKYKLDPNKIKLEITENMTLGTDNVTKEQIEKLHKIGVRFAIDDFGMGHSSLLYLQRMKIDTIKIDGSLIKNIINDKNSQDIVNSICYLAKNSKINMIAEFVETEEQKEFLKEMGIINYQGYLYSQALNKEKCEEYLLSI